MCICPQHFTIHFFHCLKQVVVIVPIKANVYKTENVTDKNREQRFEVYNPIAMRHLYFQYHNGDDDGQYAIAKSF